MMLNLRNISFFFFFFWCTNISIPPCMNALPEQKGLDIDPWHTFFFFLDFVGRNLQVWTRLTDCDVLAESQTHHSLALSFSVFCFQRSSSHKQPMNHCLVTTSFPESQQEDQWIKLAFSFLSFSYSLQFLSSAGLHGVKGQTGPLIHHS